jgi:hypothetical protein
MLISAADKFELVRTVKSMGRKHVDCQEQKGAIALRDDEGVGVEETRWQ